MRVCVYLPACGERVAAFVTAVMCVQEKFRVFERRAYERMCSCNFVRVRKISHIYECLRVSGSRCVFCGHACVSVWLCVLKMRVNVRMCACACACV